MKTLKATPQALRAGFSLAELMVVIVIIALLATFVARNVLPYLMTANRTKAMADITVIEQAIDAFAIENAGRLPDNLDILVTPDENGVTILKNLTSVPLDPWKNPYMYEPDPNGMTFELISYGKDGQPGGEGNDADISNKTMRESS